MITVEMGHPPILLALRGQMKIINILPHVASRDANLQEGQKVFTSAKEFKSRGIDSGHQDGSRLIVLVDQFGCRDVMVRGAGLKIRRSQVQVPLSPLSRVVLFSFVLRLGLPFTLTLSRKRSYLKTLFKAEEYENAGPFFQCGQTELFQNDDVTIVM